MRADIAVPRRPPTRPVIAKHPSRRGGACIAGTFLRLAVGDPREPLVHSARHVRQPERVHLSIDSTNDGRDGWVSLATARRRSTTALEETFDQGDVWIFRFAGQGRDAGELQISRRDLERANWTVQIPERIAEELRAKGAPPNP